MLRSNTPIEIYTIQGCKILVKREDLSSPPPGPPFSKMRGVVAHIRNRSEQVIGVLDTFHSQGGWAVAQACAELGRRAIVYYPVYKGETGLREFQQRALELGAELKSLPAGRSAVLYHAARRSLMAATAAYMMPNALKLWETVEETAKEVAYVPEHLVRGTWVVSASSATLAAGVMAGLSKSSARPRIIVHLGYSRPESAVRHYVSRYFGIFRSQPAFDLVDEGYAYKDAVKEMEAPFPCNPYYDRKALKWILNNYDCLNKPVLFWNVG